MTMASTLPCPRRRWMVECFSCLLQLKPSTIWSESCIKILQIIYIQKLNKDSSIIILIMRVSVVCHIQSTLRRACPSITPQSGTSLKSKYFILFVEYSCLKWKIRWWMNVFRWERSRGRAGRVTLIEMMSLQTNFERSWSAKIHGMLTNTTSSITLGSFYTSLPNDLNIKISTYTSRQRLLWSLMRTLIDLITS